MKVAVIQLTLAEFQDALRQYVVDHLDVDLDLPEKVIIATHGKGIAVELQAGGLVTADEFCHRAGAA